MDDREFRNRVLASLFAATVFLLLLEPLVRSGRSVIGNFAWAVLLKQADQVYTNASLGHRNWVDVLMFTLVIIGFVVPMTLFFTVVAVGGERFRGMILRRAKPESLARRRLWRGVQLLLAVFVLVTGLRTIASVWVDLQLNASFEQRLTVLAPHVEEIEIKRLRAAWAMMRGRDDYLTVNATLESLAAARRVTLPRVLLK